MEIIEKIVTPESWAALFNGALISLLVATSTLVFGTIIGVVGAAAKLSDNKFLQALANIYVQFIRGTPMLLQILFFYLAGPTIWKSIFGVMITPNPILVGIIAMSINSGAYSTELIRSAVQSIDKGQWEASKALGLSYTQMMRFVILPQSFKRILPPFISEYVTLIKDSSLLSTIGAIELLRSAQVIGSRYYNYIVPLCMASVMYLVMTMIITFFANKLERKLRESDV